MIRHDFVRSAAPVAVSLFVGMASVMQGAVVFEDAFTEFSIGGQWQPYGAGVPEVSLGIVGLGTDGKSLRMGSAAGTADEVVGIQTAATFPLSGVTLVRVSARLRPLNQTGAGEGGASDASAGVSILGSSGNFTQASAGANRPSAPDWGDFYVDSEGSANKRAAFVHFPPNDPNGGAEAFRTFVLEITADGTSLTTLSSSGEPLAVTLFDAFNPNLPLEAYGDSFTVALFQQRSDINGAPENTFGDFDSIQVEVVSAADDTDGDGMPNGYEAANGLNPEVNDAALDLDSDGLSNLAEFQRGSKANVPDTDGDGLLDGVESGTGVYVGPGDTGTNALKADSDNDGLSDKVETNTGSFVSDTDTGSNPSAADTDGDGFNDGVEVASGFNPTSSDSTPDGSAAIRTAVEFEFFAARGVSYRIEGSADLLEWSTVEAAVTGGGNKISRLYSTQGRPERYFRAVRN
jgi:hypothetical protein